MDTCEAWRGYGEVASQIGYRSYRLWQASFMSYAMTIARAGCTRRRAVSCGSTGSWRKKKAEDSVVVSSIEKRLHHRNISKYYSCNRLSAACGGGKFIVHSLAGSILYLLAAAISFDSPDKPIRIK